MTAISKSEFDKTLTVMGLVEYLWRLVHNSGEGYSIEIFPGGEFRLYKGDDVAFFEDKHPHALVHEMVSRTIPSRMSVEFTREELERLRAGLGLMGGDGLRQKLDKALADGMPQKLEWVP